MLHLGQQACDGRRSWTTLAEDPEAAQATSTSLEGVVLQQGGGDLGDDVGPDLLVNHLEDLAQQKRLQNALREYLDQFVNGRRITFIYIVHKSRYHLSLIVLELDRKSCCAPRLGRARPPTPPLFPLAMSDQQGRHSSASAERRRPSEPWQEHPALPFGDVTRCGSGRSLALPQRLALPSPGARTNFQESSSRAKERHRHPLRGKKGIVFALVFDGGERAVTRADERVLRQGEQLLRIVPKSFLVIVRGASH